MPWGAMCGAKIATRAKKTMRAKPTRAFPFRQNRCAAIRTADRPGRRTAGAVPRLDVTDSGVEESIEDIHAEIHEHEHERKQQDARKDYRVVAEENRIVHKPSDARPREDRLGQDSSGEQRAHLKADDRDDGKQSVAQPVADDDAPCGYALGASCANIVL